MATPIFWLVLWGEVFSFQASDTVPVVPPGGRAILCFSEVHLLRGAEFPATLPLAS
ncbi:hypothetical protein [Jonesia quinghaiensis]|uniref:hypothetical protein n=1 Tax=Jonesia quinghaiensis TaxID=262806 RepID=UPI000425F619|nr:hypothetical protein [Jonesia quinghaiensis]